MGIWFWPERNSDMMESILSVATSDKKHALTIGWMNAGMALSNPMMVSALQLGEHLDANLFAHLYHVYVDDAMIYEERTPSFRFVELEIRNP